MRPSKHSPLNDLADRPLLSSPASAGTRAPRSADIYMLSAEHDQFTLAQLITALGHRGEPVAAEDEPRP